MIADRFDRRTGLIVALGVVLLVGVVIGAVLAPGNGRPVDGAPPATETVPAADAPAATAPSSPDDGEPTTPSATGDVPRYVTDRSLNLSAITVNFSRPDEATLFYFNSHDPAVVTSEAGHLYLLVHNEIGRRILYRSGEHFDPTDAGHWLPVDNDVIGSVPNSSIDTMVQVDGRYYAYRDGDVYTTTDPESGEWTYRSDAPPGDDQGVYYDADRGLFHLFYEAGNRSDHSSGRIGHATSPNGVDNWTVYPAVYTAPEGYGVGDFDVVERNGVYLLFGDYTMDHPNYSVAVWANDNLYTNFTRLGIAMSPASFEDSRFDSYGVQDAEIVPDFGDNRFVMYAHGHSGELGPRYLHYYEGRIVVGDGATANESSN